MSYSVGVISDFSCLFFEVEVLRIIAGESGGIGRRAGLRIQWDFPWGFDSPLSHIF